MSKWIFIPLFLLFFTLVPIRLAAVQDVETASAYQQVMLLASVGAFGLLLGSFWLSRLLPRGAVNMRFSSLIGWHKYIGYAVGLFFLVHPVLMLSPRLWSLGGLPTKYLILLFKSPLMLGGVIAWFMMIAFVVTAFFRKFIPAKIFRCIHGLFGAVFTGTAAWHVVRVGRHSCRELSVFWIALTVLAVSALLFSYIPFRPKKTRTHINLGGQHESA